MNPTTTIEIGTMPKTTASRARRAYESTFNYIRTGMSALLAAATIAILGAGTAHAGGQALWVANGANVVEFDQLPDGTHDDKPKLILNSAVFGAPQGVAFDASNNLWVIDGGTTIAGGTIAPSLEEFTAAQLKNLKKVPTPTPAVQITSNKFGFPQQAVFDAAGNLWLSDNASAAVFVITPAQLAMNGSVDPTTTISSDPAFQGPLGIVLHNGNLYIANNAATTIFEFNSNHLPAIGSGFHTLVPDVILDDDGNNSIQAPWALIFDQEGDLWSSNANNPNTLVEFTAGQITSSGAPTPAVTISPFNVEVSKKPKTFDLSLVAPNGIAFDQKGNLAAISSASPFGVAVYNRKQEMNGGSLKPKSFLVGAKTTLNAPAGDVFGPSIGK
jgi:hypothetical protein